MEWWKEIVAFFRRYYKMLLLNGLFLLLAFMPAKKKIRTGLTNCKLNKICVYFFVRFRLLHLNYWTRMEARTQYLQIDLIHTN